MSVKQTTSKSNLISSSFSFSFSFSSLLRQEEIHNRPSHRSILPSNQPKTPSLTSPFLSSFSLPPVPFSCRTSIPASPTLLYSRTPLFSSLLFSSHLPIPYNSSIPNPIHSLEYSVFPLPLSKETHLFLSLTSSLRDMGFEMCACYCWFDMKGGKNGKKGRKGKRGKKGKGEKGKKGRKGKEGKEGEKGKEGKKGEKGRRERKGKGKRKRNGVNDFDIVQDARCKIKKLFFSQLEFSFLYFTFFRLLC